MRRGSCGERVVGDGFGCALGDGVFLGAGLGLGGGGAVCLGGGDAARLGGGDAARLGGGRRFDGGRRGGGAGALGHAVTPTMQLGFDGSSALSGVRATVRAAAVALGSPAFAMVLAKRAPTAAAYAPPFTAAPSFASTSLATASDGAAMRREMNRVTKPWAAARRRRPPPGAVSLQVEETDCELTPALSAAAAS